MGLLGESQYWNCRVSCEYTLRLVRRSENFPWSFNIKGTFSVLIYRVIPVFAAVPEAEDFESLLSALTAATGIAYRCCGG